MRLNFSPVRPVVTTTRGAFLDLLMPGRSVKWSFQGSTKPVRAQDGDAFQRLPSLGLRVFFGYLLSPGHIDSSTTLLRPGPSPPGPALDGGA